MPRSRQTVEHASRQMWLPPTSRAKNSFFWLGSFAALAILLAVLSWIPAVRDGVVSLFGHHEEHIAVLPFENVGNNPANEAVSEGLMESLSSRLTNLDVGQQSVWVVPASEIRRLKITDPGGALRQLDATMVVKGSIAREGDDVRLTVNLINTKTLRQVGSAALEDRAGDLATLQDEAISRLARLMHICISTSPQTCSATPAAPSAQQRTSNI
jgi:eukaryotic-like serine/threonine-protein kinase